MRVSLQLRLGIFGFVFIFVGCGAALAVSQKKTVQIQESFYVSPQSYDEVWDSATLVVKVSVQDSEPVLERKDSGGGMVFTRHRAKILRVFKGDGAVGAVIEFLQGGGEIETADRIIRADGAPLLRTDHTYVVFLKSLPQFSAPILNYNNYGAFEIVRSRVMPLAGGEEWDQRRNMSEKRFSSELDMMRAKRGGFAK